MYISCLPAASLVLIEAWRRRIPRGIEPCRAWFYMLVAPGSNAISDSTSKDSSAIEP